MDTIYKATNTISQQPMRLRLSGATLLRQEHDGNRWQTTEWHTLTRHQARTLQSAVANEVVRDWLASYGPDLY